MFQRGAAVGPREWPQVLTLAHQQVIKPHEGRVIGQHGLGHGLAAQPLLQGVEAGRAACLTALMAAAYQQFSVQHGGNVQRCSHFWKSAGNVVAGTGIEPAFPVDVDQLHADAVPFPLGGIVGHVDGAVLQRVGQHEGAEQRQVLGAGCRAAVDGPIKQGGIGRGLAVPMLFHIINGNIEGLGKGHLGQPRRNPDPHGPGRQFQQGIAAIGIEPVEQGRKLGIHRCAGHRRQGGNRFADARRWRHISRRFGPEQADRFRRIADKVARQGEQFGVGPLHYEGANG